MAGFKVADTYVAISLEMAEYIAGLRAAEGEAKTTGARIKAAFGKGSLGGFVEDLRLGRSLTGSIGDLFKNLGKEIANLPVKALHAAFSGIKTVIGGIGGAIKDIGKGILQGVGIGAGFGLIEIVSQLVTAIPNLIERGREYGQVVADVAQVTGTAGTKASEFVGVLAQLDVPLNNIFAMLGQFQRNINTPLVQKKGAEIGVMFKNAKGEALDAIEVLGNYQKAFERLGVTSQTMAAFAQATGRGGIKILDDYVRMTTADIDKLRERAHYLGLVMSSEQAQLAENMRWAGKQMELSLTGVGVALYEALGPSIIDLLESAAKVIADNRDKIVEALGSIAATVVNFIAALFGAQDQIDSFVGSLNSVTQSRSPLEGQIRGLTAQIDELDSNFNGIVDTEERVTDTTGAATAAIEKQVKALQELERQQDRTYKKALTALNDQLDAQLKILDAEDRARQDARTDLQLKEALDRAKIDLATAMNRARENVLTGKTDKSEEDKLAIAEAAKKVSDAQEAILEEARQRAQDARREAIQTVKDYLSEIEKLVSDAASSPLAAKEDLAALTAREKDLRKEGAASAPEGSDLAIKLAAVLAAEKRVREASANQLAQADLEADRQRLASARSTATSVKQEWLTNLYKQRDELIAEQKRQEKALAELKKHWHQLGETIGGNGEGSLPTWYEKARVAGEKWATTVLETLKSMKSTIGDIIDLIKQFKDLVNDRTFLVVLAALVGFKVGGPQGAAIAGILMGLKTSAPDVSTITKTVDDTVLAQGSRLGPPAPDVWSKLQKWMHDNLLGPDLPGQAEGGFQSPGWNLVGERGPELVFSGGNDYVLNSQTSAALARLNAGFMPTMSPAMAGAGGEPAIIRIEVGGQKLIDYFDRQLLYRRRR